MRRIFALVAGATLLSACAPREIIGALVPLVLPQCDSKREFCPDPGAVSAVDSEPPGYPPLAAPVP